MEKTIEARLKNRIELVGGLCWKFVSPGTAGVPDRIVLLPGGRVLFVELKDSGKGLRPLQKYRKRQLEDRGFDVRVIDREKLLEELEREISTA